MWRGRRYTPKQIKEHRRGVFVGGHRSAKYHVSQMLQRVRESVISKLTGCPQTIAFGEFLGRQGGQSEQIVGAVFDHVDAQIVSRIDTEVRPVRVSQGKPGKLDRPVK